MCLANSLHASLQFFWLSVWALCVNRRHSREHKTQSASQYITKCPPYPFKRNENERMWYYFLFLRSTTSNTISYFFCFFSCSPVFTFATFIYWFSAFKISSCDPNSEWCCEWESEYVSSTYSTQILWAAYLFCNVILVTLVAAAATTVAQCVPHKTRTAPFSTAMCRQMP